MNTVEPWAGPKVCRVNLARLRSQLTQISILVACPMLGWILGVSLASGIYVQLESKVEQCLLFRTVPSKQNITVAMESVGESQEMNCRVENEVSHRVLYTSSEINFTYQKVTDGNTQIKLCCKSGTPTYMSFSFTVESQVEDEELDEMSRLIRELQTKTKQIKKLQEFDIQRAHQNLQIGDTMHNRLRVWTILEVVVLILLTASQAYYMRNYFAVKTVV